MSRFDYVIVGGGSAGCVLANRLSADPKTSVLLLEAGIREPIPAVHVPRMWRSLWGSDVDWGYITEPQPGLDDRTINCPRGKVLGGTSAINAMVYIRGNRRDFDGWRDLGNVEWSY